MKIVTKKLEKGIVVVVPEYIDDLWHLYNIILPGDQIAARTVRRVRRESKDGSRPDKGERKRMFIRLAVDEVSLHKYSNRLRVKGRILEGPEDLVTMGSFHTINIALGIKIEIVKTHWPRSLLRRLKEAASRKGQRIIVIAIEEECASIGVIDDTGVDVRAELHGKSMGKYGNYVQSSNISEKLFTSVAMMLNELLNQLPDITHVIVVGPGSTKEQLAEFLRSKVPLSKDFLILDHCSSGTVAGIQEALNRGVVERIAGELRLNREIRLMDDLMLHLGKETGKAVYGWEEIERAVQFGAVESLMILDKTLRESPPETRLKLENIMRRVEEQGGSVDILSSEHQAGKQLGGLGGIAGILRFSLPVA
ncbi:MAG: mRNA surveillance protein pelota [Promethearchaeota archaeon]